MEKKCSESLDKFPEQVPLGGGNGWALEGSTYCHYATSNGVHAIFAGEMAEWPGIDVVSANHDAFVRGEPEGPPTTNDASWLLKFYETFMDASDEDVTQCALTALSKLRGNFAFVLYDTGLQRVLAARDREAVQPLYWGITPDERFMISSHVEDLVDCDPSATPFPAGALFASETTLRAENPGPAGWIIPGESHPGRLLSFVETKAGHLAHSVPAWRTVRAVPRVTSRGLICGAVYRVASERNINSVAAN